MEYRVLGSLEVRSGDEIVALGPPKQRATLAILLLHAGEIVPTDLLIELLWGDRPPRTAGHSVQIYISELRKALDRNGGGPPIATRPPGYVLVADPDAIDVRRFERLIAQGTRDLEEGREAAATAALGEALRLWRGPPLSDFAYEEFAQEEIRRLDELHVDALERSAAAELALGRDQAALSSIQAALAADPLRERSRELQLQVLYRSGRQPEALRAYETFRSLLADELGVEPSPSLRQLQERMLIHDPSLGPAVAPGAAATPTPTRNPFKGLRPFGEEDAGDFFGRDALVADLVAGLAGGARLLALVGPSGSGKSSVIRAGLLPAVRAGALPDAEAWLMACMAPGRDPFVELEAALHAVTGASVLGGEDASLLEVVKRVLPGGRRLLLVIDQFEELFSLGDDPSVPRFLGDIAAAVDDPGGPVTVVLALRADAYDRPLLHPDFAAVFTRAVVNVVPMTARDLEEAVVRPAQRVGVTVEPALLAQLLEDTAGQPGALPLLQYALTEVFDQRAGSTLILGGYQALGGLRAALSRRADELYEGLAEDRRQASLQVFLRLVRLGEGPRQARRRVSLSELTALGLDPVALSEILDTFGRHRLLTFDRDPATGSPTVEVAHEALLAEWKRLAGWIDRHRADLRKRESLAGDAGEWEASGRDPDYLLIGSRLVEAAAWSTTTTLRLTAKERAFLDAGIARRDAELAEEAARHQERRRLERRAKARLWAFLAAAAVLVAVAGIAVVTWLGSGPPDVALLFEGTGDAGFGDMAAAGLDRAASEFGLDAESQTVTVGSREVEAELRRLSDEGVPLVVVGLGTAASDAVNAVAAEHLGTRYVAWETGGDLPGNVTNIGFRSEEAAYLAGAAAALESRTGIVGFIGSWDIPPIESYLDGFTAGARSVDRDITIGARYLAPVGDLSAFSSPRLGTEAATRLYADGVDVILAVAGDSNRGVFEAAASESERQGRQLWAIGTDTDEYASVVSSDELVPEGQDPETWQPHILTSVTKRLDEAIYTMLAEHARSSLVAGDRSLGLAEHGVDISYSGGFLDDVRPRLEELRQRIVAGEIEVPTSVWGSTTP